MKKATRFYICEKCGNLVHVVKDSGVNPVCCGEKMKELVAGVVEASHEKHIPVVTVDGNLVKVNVGSVEHPMSEEHSILWVYLETEGGGYLRYLKVGENPQAEFCVKGDKPVAVYAYCNLHGLWKQDV